MFRAGSSRAIIVFGFAVSLAILSSGCGASETSNGTGPIAPAEFGHLSPLAKEVLKDKLVTDAELSAGTQGYKDCLTTAGITWSLSDPARVQPGTIATTYIVPEGANNGEEVLAAFEVEENRCRSQVAPIEDVWTLQHQPSDQQLIAAKATFVDCVYRAGLRIAPGATFDEAGSAFSEYFDQPGSRPDDISEKDRYQALEACASAIQQSVIVAPPGVEQALAELDTSGW